MNLKTPMITLIGLVLHRLQTLSINLDYRSKEPRARGAFKSSRGLYATNNTPVGSLVHLRAVLDQLVVFRHESARKYMTSISLGCCILIPSATWLVISAPLTVGRKRSKIGCHISGIFLYRYTQNFIAIPTLIVFKSGLYSVADNRDSSSQAQ